MRWPARDAALTLEGLTALCGAIFAPTDAGVRMIALAAIAALATLAASEATVFFTAVAAERCMWRDGKKKRAREARA